MFSPPNTRVNVKADRVGSGFVVEIEDRGLSIPAGELAVINHRLADSPEFDLADSDQLGLFVVSQLASRHGIKVSLRESPYGGTTAIVLMPRSIVVAEGDSDADDRDGASLAGAGDGSGWHPASSDDGLSGGMRYSQPESPPDLEPAGARAQPAGGPPWRTLAAMEPVPRPHQEDAPAGPAGAAAGIHPGLPRRVRQASLAPQLRDAAPAGAATPQDGTSDARSPEDARALLVSFQRGWRRGRADASPAGEGSGGAQDTRPDSGDGEAEQ
jgi:hypothetical protein